MKHVIRIGSCVMGAMLIGLAATPAAGQVAPGGQPLLASPLQPLASDAPEFGGKSRDSGAVEKLPI